MSDQVKRLLIANRGEIAVRIARAAADLGIETTSIYSEDDADCIHRHVTDQALQIPGIGAKAFLNIAKIIEIARESNSDAIHPGYGFLAENADFAQAAQDAGITFVGPRPETLRLFGDKAKARHVAEQIDVPIIRGTSEPVSCEQARDMLEEFNGSPMILKAVAGGGGRGSRMVFHPDELDEAFARASSEAKAAFANDSLYAEELISDARHIEVQVIGDATGTVCHLYERECSAQRRHQKVVEVAPAPELDEDVRSRLVDAAIRFAEHTNYVSLGTFEFLVCGESTYFIETNARLQVEHTITEEVTGVDLVQAQLLIASGKTLAELELDEPPKCSGYAIQARVNMEKMIANGTVLPTSGTLTAYDSPSGPGVRTDGMGYTGYATSINFDSLLAKVIVRGRTVESAVRSSLRALSEFRIEGVETNIPFLQNTIAHKDFANGKITTRWVDDNIETLAAPSEANKSRVPLSAESASGSGGDGFAGARVDTSDPLALFDHDAKIKAEAQQQDDREISSEPIPELEGATGLSSSIQGTIVSITVSQGDEVAMGQQVAVVEAMKMEHVIAADHDGIVRKVTMAPGDVVKEGYPIVFVERAEISDQSLEGVEEVDLDHIRDDLKLTYERHAYVEDENRPEAVAKRYARGYRMPRENIAELMDPGSFKEYWPLIVARQHSRHDMETLRKNTPADGLIAGIGTVNADLFGEDAARTMLVHYDYTVLAGTQGGRNHYKQDRMFELASRFRIPLILFGEGGGGRPGDDSRGPGVAFDTHTFTQFSKLSGLVPMISVINGRTFAGNTALVACCDVIIATEKTTVAMGGPAMIEGGGLGIYTPEEVGPMSFQVPNGVVDILAKDEADAVQVAKKYLSYFQGDVESWESHDQRKLRHVVPENRLRLYNMKDIVHTIADVGSVLEVREKFGIGVITAFIRVEGKPMGVIANNPHHLAGAIDSDGADKGARFIQLCDAFDLPVLSLMDCPGMMVGPNVEKTALVRHCVRMFNAGANLTTPLFGVVVRKAYGLGVQAMCGASSLVGFFTVAWPTAEFAGMNIEGSVKLGFRKELAAIEDPEDRRIEFERRVARSYEGAKAINAGVGGGLDDVIDPAETRSWIASSLKRLPPRQPRTEKKYPYIDTW